jgi:hypothetical protein
MEKASAMWGISRLWVVMLLGMVVTLTPVWAADPVLQQAQQKLLELGYDPGSADGVSGPRTRQAIEAFQRAQNLPATGTLDTPTLEALRQGGGKTGAPETETTTALSFKSPLSVVVNYLRFHALQPARAWQYLTEDFRQGLSPQEWLLHAQQARQGQGETYIGWRVQRQSVADTQAIIYVQTRVLAQGQEHTRHEVFTLVRAPEGEWLIDGWRLEAFPSERSPSRPGS